MATETQPGADFWADLGVVQQDGTGRQDTTTEQPDEPAAPEPAKPEAPSAQDDWASMFSKWDEQPAAPKADKTPPKAMRETDDASPESRPTPDPATATSSSPKKSARSAKPRKSAPEPIPFAPVAPATPDPVVTASTAPAPAVPALTVTAPTVTAPIVTAPIAADPASSQENARPAEPRTAPPADPAWATAERIAETLRPQIVIGLADGDTDLRQQESWRGVLSQHTSGDTGLADKVYDVLSGWHLLGRLWRDDRVHEMHIRGARVTVAGTQGVHQIPGFPDLGTARRTVETITRGQADAGATVTRIGDSIVVGRLYGRQPDTATLVASGVISPELLSQVERTLERTGSVTVTGAAAPAVTRAFASLIPAGSRIFEGPYGVLPAGCVAAASPLDADYVVGVRPGALAEEMAASGQLGALIANPQTPFQATLRLVVTGRTSALEKVTAHRSDPPA